MTRAPGSQEHAFLDLVAEAMACFEEGGRDSLERFLRDHPDRSEAVRERVHALGNVGLLLARTEDRVDGTPKQLGEYVLIERLGGGGMGIVYLAEQPSLKRQVALKLIRPEHLYFPNAKERFRREVEAVAGLQHPNIVQVYSVGEEEGLPYFTMERVHGVSLAVLIEELRTRRPDGLDDRMLHDLLEDLRGARNEGPLLAARGETPLDSPGCESRPLRRSSSATCREVASSSLLAAGFLARARSDAEFHHGLLEPRGSSWNELCTRWLHDLASALDYTHSRGTLHRDLKPSNVMLTWSGQVKLLDFGLASSRESSTITRTGSVVGSLPYMAPEQIRGHRNAVTARTDVYALGVILYELLTLRHPYHEPPEPIETTRRKILEAIPAPIRSRNRAVSWELETVCMAAMDPDIRRRYPSAAALAQDLRNVLELRPIRARRPSALLRLRRLSQRHPAWSVGAVLGFLLFVVGPSAFAIYERQQSAHLRAAWDKAQLEAGISEATLQFLDEDLLTAVGPGEVGKDASMRAVLDAASEKIEGRFPDQPLVEAAIRRTMGRTYRLLGVYEIAEEHVQKALALQIEHAGPEDPATLRVKSELAELWWQARRLDESTRLHAEVLEGRRRVLGEEDPSTLSSMNNLGHGYAELGRFAEAEALLLDVLEKRIRLLGEKHEKTLVTMSNLGFLYRRMGRYGEAERWERHQYELCRESLGDDHPSTITSLNNLADGYVASGRNKEAQECLTRVVEQAERVLGADHSLTLDYLVNLARICRPHDLAGCERALDVFDARSGALGQRHETVLRARITRAELRRSQGRFAEAEEILAAALDDCRDALGEDHRLSAEAHSCYADLLADQGEWRTALELDQKALAYAGTALTGVDLVYTHLSAAKCQHALAEYAGAERSLFDAKEAAAAAGLPDAVQNTILQKLIALYGDWGKPDELARWKAELEVRTTPER
jgi:serine/threonine protein kinase/tetratricopeptide (TPR) repeat protein